MSISPRQFIVGTTFSSVVVGLILCPVAGLAQIASPNNAGQNSGNNSFGSALTSIGTPNFSTYSLVSLVSGVTVQPDGTITGDPAVIDSIRRALRDAITRNSTVLGPVTLAPLPRSGAVDEMLLASAADIPLAAAPAPAAVVSADDRLSVTVAGELVEIPITPANRSALRTYVDQALKAGFTPASLGLGAQLVSIGAPVEPTLELTASLQGLAAQPTLGALAQGIAAFNVIVNGASPNLRNELNNSPVFIAASNALRAARAAMPSQP